jgi:hypothetical protein
MIFDPKGCFFVRKAFYDDLLRDAPEAKGQALEPVIQLLLVRGSPRTYLVDRSFQARNHSENY